MKRLIGKPYGNELRMYYVGSKLLNGTKCMYVNDERESECFRIDNSMRQDCIMSPWLLNPYMGVVMKEVKMRIGRREQNFWKRGESGAYQATRMQMTRL